MTSLLWSLLRPGAEAPEGRGCLCSFPGRPSRTSHGAQHGAVGPTPQQAHCVGRGVMAEPPDAVDSTLCGMWGEAEPPPPERPVEGGKYLWAAASAVSWGPRAHPPEALELGPVGDVSFTATPPYWPLPPRGPWLIPRGRSWTDRLRRRRAPATAPDAPVAGPASVHRLAPRGETRPGPLSPSPARSREWLAVPLGDGGCGGQALLWPL